MLTLSDRSMISAYTFLSLRRNENYYLYMCHGCGQLYGSAAGFPVIPAGPEFRVRARGPQDPY